MGQAACGEACVLVDRIGVFDRAAASARDSIALAPRGLDTSRS